MWTGSGQRYGLFNLHGVKIGAHVVAWMRAYGLPVPKGMQVMHSCDTPKCVNPAHLTVGTPSDNVKDMVAKGRDCKSRPYIKPAHGENIWRQMADLNAWGMTQKEISEHYGVATGTVSHYIARLAELLYAYR